MRVLHVIAALADRYGGPSAAMVAMCHALKSQGVEVEIATTDADGAGRLDVPLGTPTSWKGIPTYFFGRDWSESFKYSRGLGGFLRKQAGGYDLLHVHGVFSHSSVAAAKASEALGVPYVVRPIGHLNDWSLGQRSARKLLFLRTLGRKLLTCAAAVHFATDAERQAYEKRFGPVPGFVSPLGMDLPSETSRGVSRQPAVLLFVGRIHPVKGLDRFLEGLAALASRAQGQEWRAVIAGEGDPSLLASLKDRASRPDLAGRVEFPGWLDESGKREAMMGASAFVLLSRTESLGLALLEAMSAGVPAIVSRGVQLSEAIEASGAGWAVNPTEPGWVDTLASVIGDPQERAARGRRARQFVEESFSWPVVARTLVGQYRSITGRQEEARSA